MRVSEAGKLAAIPNLPTIRHISIPHQCSRHAQCVAVPPWHLRYSKAFFVIWHSVHTSRNGSLHRPVMRHSFISMNVLYIRTSTSLLLIRIIWNTFAPRTMVYSLCTEVLA